MESLVLINAGLDYAVTLDQFKSAAEKSHEILRKTTNKIGAGLIELWTNQPYLPTINRFFKMRAARRR